MTMIKNKYFVIILNDIQILLIEDHFIDGQMPAKSYLIFRCKPMIIIAEDKMLHHTQYLDGLIHVKTLESHVFNVAEVRDQFLISSPLLVKPDVVNGDVGGVDEADGD